MAFFQFGRKLDLTKDYSFEQIPIFSTLTPAEQKIIEKKIRLVEYKKGDGVYEEGTPPDAFYVVISGRFRIFNKTRGNAAGDTLLFLYRGDHFGETSLLTGKLHSASVEAKSDGMILRIEKDDFLRMVKEIPAVSLHLSRSLGHRLTKSEDASGRRREVKIAGLYAKEESENVFQFWVDFAAALVRETKRKIILVDLIPTVHPLFRDEFKKESVSSFDLLKSEAVREGEMRSCLLEHPSGFYFLHVPTDSIEEKDERKLSSLLTFLTYRYDYLLLRLPTEMNHITFKILKTSDMVYVFSPPEPEKLAEYALTLAEFQQTFGFSHSEIKVIVPEEAKGKLSFEEKESLLQSRIFSLLPSKESQADRYLATLRYLAKELAGTLLGLVLGSGAAYGLAHIGVLRVLEQENIPIDVIAGSSIGALVGALWAAGYDADELERLAKSINKQTGFFKLIGFNDVSIAHRGFFKGNQVSRFIESYVGNKTFQDLRIPVKIVAANLFTSNAVVFEAGRIVDAIRASVSIPGIFRPYLHKGEYLIDGGVIDPLPVRVLANLGVKKIIAVNVLSGPKDRVERIRLQEEERKRKLVEMAQKNIWSKALAGAMDKLYDRYSINIFNVIMHTIQFMEFEMAESWSKEADVLIHPVVHNAHWAEFYNPEKFIKAGEEKVREQLAEIKRLLVE